MFREFLVRDVGLNGDHSHRSARLRVAFDHASAAEEPAPVAVLVAQAELGIQKRNFADHVAPADIPDLVDVLGVHQLARQPRGHVGVERLGGAHKRGLAQLGRGGQRVHGWGSASTKKRHSIL